MSVKLTTKEEIRHLRRLFVGEMRKKLPVTFPQVFLQIVPTRKFLCTMWAWEGNSIMFLHVILQLWLKFHI